VAAAAQRGQEPCQLSALGGCESAEDLLGCDPAGPLEAFEQGVTPGGQAHEDRAPVVRIGGPDDEAGRLHPVDHGGDGPGDDLEPCRDVGHLEWLAGGRDDP
jgi:hypothetical protein